ncbi:MAG: phosphatidate cytidylyltransferase [Bacillota bacterium]
MLRARVLTAVVGAPLILSAAWLGGVPLLTVVAVLVLLAAGELAGLVRSQGPHRGLAIAGALTLVGAAYLLEEAYPGPAITLVTVLFLVVFTVAYPRISPSSLCATLFVALYASLLVYAYLLRVLPGGPGFLLLALTGTWAFDTFGYFVGVSVGRIRITPHLSPKKSLEGLLGGLAGAVLAAYAFALITGAVPLGLVLLLGLLIGVAAQLGDLVVSALKRFADVKDAGSLLPGHGGVLDRFDSFLLTAPVVYYLVQVFGVSLP